MRLGYAFSAQLRGARLVRSEPGGRKRARGLIREALSSYRELAWRTGWTMPASWSKPYDGADVDFTPRAPATIARARFHRATRRDVHHGLDKPVRAVAEGLGWLVRLADCCCRR